MLLYTFQTYRAELYTSMCSWHELEESADYGKFLFYITKLLEKEDGDL